MQLVTQEAPTSCSEDAKARGTRIGTNRCGCAQHDSLAEWSKALAQGASPQGRGFEPHSCHFDNLPWLGCVLWLGGSNTGCRTTLMVVVVVKRRGGGGGICPWWAPLMRIAGCITLSDILESSAEWKALGNKWLAWITAWPPLRGMNPSVQISWTGRRKHLSVRDVCQCSAPQEYAGMV